MLSPGARGSLEEGEGAPRRAPPLVDTCRRCSGVLVFLTSTPPSLTHSVAPSFSFAAVAAPSPAPRPLHGENLAFRSAPPGPPSAADPALRRHARTAAVATTRSSAGVLDWASATPPARATSAEAWADHKRLAAAPLTLLNDAVGRRGACPPRRLPLSNSCRDSCNCKWNKSSTCASVLAVDCISL